MRASEVRRKNILIGALLESQETWFNNHSGWCNFDTNNFECSDGDFTVTVWPGGSINFADDDGWCNANGDGSSYCYVLDH